MEKITKDLFSLKDRVAVVTGGYGHLGSSMARSLNAFGATVIVAGRNEKKYVNAFSARERKSILFRELDITLTSSIEHCITNTLNEFVHIDILVNNAHTAKGNSQENMSDEDWTYTMEGIVGSIHKTMRAIIPNMKRQKSGKIINVTSMYGIVSPDFRLYKGDNCEVFTNPPHYGAGKAAMIQLTKYYAVLLGEFNIQVNALSPGPFPKPEIQKANPEFIKRLIEKNPMNRIGSPEDIAGAIVLLGSRASDFITGQTIQVDGGWTIW